MRYQWFRAGSLAGCLIVACGCSSASQNRAPESVDTPAAQTSAPASTPDGTTNPVQTPVAAEQGNEPIVQRARAVLVAAKVPGAADARVLSVEAHEWSDSSLGCRGKGQSYLQVITPGHIVKFDIGGVPTAVNVAGETAVFCGQSVASDRLPKRPNYPVRAAVFEKASADARADLAAKLGVPVEEIKVVAAIPFVWEDGTFRCGSAEDPRPQVRGYKLQLTRGPDAYYYHTDFTSTFACPAVEVQ